MNPESVIIVEDDLALRQLLEREFTELGLRVTSVASGEEALATTCQSPPTLIVTDLRLPGLDGIALTERIRSELAEPPPVIVMSAFGTIDRAVDALKRGAVDFLTKPLDLDHLRLRVERLLEVERLKQRVTGARSGSAERPFYGVIGTSTAMRRLMAEVTRIASGRGSVLIGGPSGVGKELVAQAIHGESARRDAPFVAVNCASVPEALLESEFFGHESGAFTGAHKRHDGLFGAAQGGTILLDEVGELPGRLQAKLLRVLQERSLRRVGATQELDLDVRVLAATNRDLQEDIISGRFRSDLFYRLAAFQIEVPTLVERDGDLKLLAAHFLDSCTRPLGKPVVGFSSEALSCLEHYAFPGNVRELENIVEHAVTFCNGDLIQLADLPERVRQRTLPDPTDATSVPSSLMMDGSILTLQEASSRYVRHVLDATGDNKRRAARLLGISRQTLYRYLRVETP